MNISVSVAFLAAALVGSAGAFHGGGDCFSPSRPAASAAGFANLLAQQPSSNIKSARLPLYKDAATTSTFTAYSSTSTSSTSLAALPNAAALTTAASQSLFPTNATPLARLLRLTAAVVSTVLLLSAKLRRKLFYPNVTVDPSHDEPIPPGSLGCPFLGQPFFQSSKSFGAGSWYRDTAQKLGNPRVWKYYFLGKPLAVISGGDELKAVLNQEFDGVTSSGSEIMDSGLMPMDSLLFEGDKSRHSFLRRLVGQSLTPARVSDAVPVLQVAADEAVRKMLDSTDGTVKMEKVCTDYTLDVAWRQILGLDLTEDEIPTFEKEVETWITGMMSLRTLLRIAVKSSPGYKAMKYVTKKIEERIAQLKETGPDASNLSGMLFAKDEEDPKRTLTSQELIDNSLILIFAGSETSASTLTNAMLFLGLHPQAWNRLVEEQMTMKARHGDTLTKRALDDECPYLDAVIKESLRMRTISGGIPRRTMKTIVVDGKQIPEGWLIDPSLLLTHTNDPKTQTDDGTSNVDPMTGFAPERWLDEKTRPDNDFVPFGSGPRFCLGYNLAMVEMKVFLATLARKISFQLDRQDNVEWQTGMGVMAQPADGVLVSVRSKEEEAALLEKA
mmetsp:Transcript_33415/g.73281  ORF Transcript_33415/g.73281 Transcript_33415/m.73281 type:complete len:613 (-) Transcript_33415:125-1963(-)